MMVISNLNTKLIEDRLGFIIGSVVKLKRLSRLSGEEFLRHDRPAVAESYLRRSLEAVFDIGRHIVAKTAGKAVVEYKQIADLLGRRGVISGQLAERLRLMAGYRNRMVHFYHEVADEELYRIVTENLLDIEDFVKEIRQFLEEYRNRGAV